MDILDRIRAYKLEEIAARKAAHPVSVVEGAARAAGPVRPFHAALAAMQAHGAYALIAEIKKASPSKGLIRADFDPPKLARAYEAGGAAALSVLTDGPSFQGSDDFLIAARAATRLPCLRKDFLYDPWQVAESRALGADCVLIILAALDDARAAEIEDAARHWGMDALLEVHDAEELDRAMSLKSPMIGINNRDLRSFETRLETTEELATRVPSDRMLVAESGLSKPADLARMAHAGARSFLIGESLMRQADVAEATRELLAHPVPVQQGQTS
jgi:indole-3-glycerol phosphate synthase